MRHGHIVFIEGLDGSGKTTLARALAPALGYRVHVYDRGLGTCFVMDHWVGRVPESRRDYLTELEELGDVYHTHQVIIKASAYLCAKRLARRGDTTTSLHELVEQENLLQQWIEMSQSRIHTVTVPHEVAQDRLPADVAMYVVDLLGIEDFDADKASTNTGGVPS